MKSIVSYGVEMYYNDKEKDKSSLSQKKKKEDTDKSFFNVITIYWATDWAN